ncbi:MAG: fluoride efflux transporter CrcB [Synergistaceae bacterium]|jgi:CrcB protein|nr:fluoride efflux transporter CrcB [Synergistaceae bacterium]
MLEILSVGFGGFLGSCARYLISKLTNQISPSFPLGTLLSNVLAGFLIGFIINFERQTAVLPDRIKLFLTVGLLGGLSTFSSFSIETVRMFENKNFIGAGGNVMLNVGLSIIFAVFGMAAAGLLLGKR